MPRPPIDNPATETIRLRVTPEDKTEIRRRAEAAGVSMSEYMLRCSLPTKEGSDRC